MADSDDEYEKKIRDKFRGERDRPDSYKGIDSRREERRPPRDEWMDRDAWTARSRGRGDFRPMIRDRHSPIHHDAGPPMKRMRNEWEDRRFFEPPNYSYPSWIAAEPPAAVNPRVPPTPPVVVESNLESQPPMMSLKAFINTLDDNVSDEEALKKYNEYKLEFKKQQLNEFFVAHKDEEWFKEKYHPVHSTKRKEIHTSNVKKRVDVFLELLESKRFDNVLVDADQADNLVKVMDMFVILLEGGSEYDFKVLESEDVPKSNSTAETENGETNSKSKVDKPEDKKSEISDEKGDKDTEINDHTVTTTQEDEKDDGKKSEENGEKEAEETGETLKSENDEAELKDGEATALKEDDPPEKNSSENGELEKAEIPIQKPRELHKTCSIFLRNLAPTITREEIENICKKFPGFLRVAIADPQPERRWYRRGWVSFSRDVDIKMIYWHITNLRDIELSPIVNRDLTRRIRTVSSITTNKRIVRNDMKLCAKIIDNLDKKFGLWYDSVADNQEFSLSRNPVLREITAYLIEEASAEEEELLGQNEPTDETDEKDLAVFKALDRMIYYLRFVHSVDYYNHCEYPSEDEMPNRCGIIHARVTSATNKVTADEVTEYCRTFQNKVVHLMEPALQLSDDEVVKLGKKDAEAEVEKFISANTQELGPQKWLCPLSGKKFKGPEFVLKHIQNKHGEKIEEVKLEVEYFNNYLCDPKRPQLPEHPVNKQPKQEPAVSNNVMAPAHPNPYPYNFAGGMFPGGYNRGMNYGYSRGPRPNYGGGRGRGMDHRPIIHYRDLDAPKEPDEFI